MAANTKLILTMVAGPILNHLVIITHMKDYWHQLYEHVYIAVGTYIVCRLILPIQGSRHANAQVVSFSKQRLHEKCSAILCQTMQHVHSGQNVRVVVFGRVRVRPHWLGLE